MSIRWMNMYKYETKTVPRCYYDERYDTESPEADCLKEMGANGWLLCGIGAPDAVGTKIMYFVKDYRE